MLSLKKMERAYMLAMDARTQKNLSLPLVEVADEYWSRRPAADKAYVYTIHPSTLGKLSDRTLARAIEWKTH